VVSTFLAELLLFAQEGAGNGGGGAGGGGGGGLGGLLIPFLAIGFLFYLLLLRPQQRERAKRTDMLAAVKKNDHVVTIGGIHGVVTNVRAEADEVTIKVDESNNTKLRMTLSSVARVLTDDTSGEKSQ